MKTATEILKRECVKCKAEMELQGSWLWGYMGRCYECKTAHFKLPWSEELSVMPKIEVQNND